MAGPGGGGAHQDGGGSGAGRGTGQPRGVPLQGTGRQAAAALPRDAPRTWGPEDRGGGSQAARPELGGRRVRVESPLGVPPGLAGRHDRVPAGDPDDRPCREPRRHAVPRLRADARSGQAISSVRRLGGTGETAAELRPLLPRQVRAGEEALHGRGRLRLPGRQREADSGGSRQAGAPAARRPGVLRDRFCSPTRKRAPSSAASAACIPPD